MRLYLILTYYLIISTHIINTHSQILQINTILNKIKYQNENEKANFDKDIIHYNQYFKNNENEVNLKRRFEKTKNLKKYFNFTLNQHEIEVLLQKRIIFPKKKFKAKAKSFGNILHLLKIVSEHNKPIMISIDSVVDGFFSSLTFILNKSFDNLLIKQIDVFLIRIISYLTVLIKHTTSVYMMNKLEQMIIYCLVSYRLLFPTRLTLKFLLFKDMVLNENRCENQLDMRICDDIHKQINNLYENILNKDEIGILFMRLYNDFMITYNRNHIKSNENMSKNNNNTINLNEYIYSQVELILKKVYLFKKENIRLFDKVFHIDFNDFQPKGIFYKSINLMNLYQCISFMTKIGFNLENHIEEIWLFNKIVVDSETEEEYKRLKEVYNYFIGLNPIQDLFSKVYTIGSDYLGVNDYYLTEKRVNQIKDYIKNYIYNRKEEFLDLFTYKEIVNYNYIDLSLLEVHVLDSKIDIENWFINQIIRKNKKNKKRTEKTEKKDEKTGKASTYNQLAYNKRRHYNFIRDEQKKNKLMVFNKGDYSQCDISYNKDDDYSNNNYYNSHIDFTSYDIAEGFMNISYKNTNNKYSRSVSNSYSSIQVNKVMYKSNLSLNINLLYYILNNICILSNDMMDFPSSSSSSDTNQNQLCQLDPLYTSENYLKKNTDLFLSSRLVLNHQSEYYENFINDNDEVYNEMTLSFPEVYIERNISFFNELSDIIQELELRLREFYDEANERLFDISNDYYITNINPTLITMKKAVSICKSSILNNNQNSYELRNVIHYNHDTKSYSGWFYDLYKHDKNWLFSNKHYYSKIYHKKDNLNTGYIGYKLYNIMNTPMIGYVIVKDVLSGIDKIYITFGLSVNEIYEKNETIPPFY